MSGHKQKGAQSKHPTKKKKDDAAPKKWQANKAFVLALAVACLSPALLGFRLWSALPDQITVPMSGSTPYVIEKATLCFVLPAAAVALQFIALLLCRNGAYEDQRLELIRQLAARWVFPLVSVFFLGGWILWSGGDWPNYQFILFCGLGFLLLVLGERDPAYGGRLCAAGSALILCGMLDLAPLWIGLAVLFVLFICFTYFKSVKGG